VLHPYYKLAYIKLAWGGPEEQAAEIARGNPYAKDWQDEAKKIVERTVRSFSFIKLAHQLNMNQMSQYYKDCPSTTPLTRTNNLTECATQAPVLSEFDKLRESLLTDDAEEGWASELRRYLGRMERDVTKETDLVEWWQVRNLLT
jgi:hypothetical protein